MIARHPRTLLSASVAICVLALALLTGSSAVAASSKSAPLTKDALTELKFTAPNARLITGKRVRVVVKTPSNVKSFRAVVGGKVISKSFRASGKNTRTANLTVSKVLRRGVNHLNVVATLKSGGKSVGELRLVVGARGKAPATASVIKQSSRYLAQIKLRDTAAHFVVKLNGRAITGSFSRFTTKKQSIPLAPDEGLRYGANTFSITAALGNGRYLRKSVRFNVSSRRPLASAGKDRRARSGDAIQFSAKRTISRAGKLKLSWRVKSAPKGARVSLRGYLGAKPILKVNRPGTYKVELSAIGNGRRGSDVATVYAKPNAPPIGPSIRTLAPQPGGGYAIELGANCIGQNAACGKLVSPFDSAKPVQLIVLERATLAPVQTFAFTSDETGASAATLEAFKLAGSGDQVDYIGVLAAMPGSGMSSQWQKATKVLTGTSVQNYANGSWSAIGVPSAATVPNELDTGSVNDGLVPALGATTGELSGNFPYDTLEQVYTFNPGHSVSYQTATAASTPTQNTMSIGTATYPSAALSAGCTGGFQLVTLRSASLSAPTSLPVNQTFDTNCANVGVSEIGMLTLEGAIQNVATASTTGADGPLLVFLQSIGSAFQPAPISGYVFGASALAAQIESLGGTGDTFMAATNNTAKGYALAGGNALRSEAPKASQSLAFAPESSDVAPGTTASLSGPLRLNRYSHFLPSGGSPTTTRIGELNEIAYQAPTPWPSGNTTSQQNALAFISEHYNIEYSPSSSCYKPVKPDVRFEYCDLNAPWTNLLDNLPSHPWSASDCGCTQADWLAIRKEIPKEIDSVNRVNEYVQLVQTIYGNGSGSSTVLGVKKIATAVNNAVNPPAGSGASGWWSDLIANIANGLAVLAPGDSALESIGDAIAAVGYLADDALTTPSGSRTLGQIVSTEAADVPSQVADRYRAASLNFANFGDIIVSDYGKLNAVAASPEIQLDGDALAGGAGDMMVGAYRFAYRQMLSAAYNTLSLPPNSYSTTATNPAQYGCFIEKNDPKTAQYPFSGVAAGAWTAMQRNGPSLPAFGNVTPWMLVWAEKNRLNLFDMKFPPQSVVGPLTPAITFNSNGIPLTFGEYAPWMMRKSFTQVPFPCISQ